MSATMRMILVKHWDGAGDLERAFRRRVDVAMERRPSIVLRADGTVVSCNLEWFELSGRLPGVLEQAAMRDALLGVLHSGVPRSGVPVTVNERAWTAQISGSGGPKPDQVLVTLVAPKTQAANAGTGGIA